MGEDRRFGRLDEVDPGRPRLQTTEHGYQTVDVHGFVKTVVEGLADEDMVGNLDGPGRRVLLAGGQGGEDGRHQIVGLHPLDGQGVLLAPPEAEDGQRTVQVPAPAGGEHG